MDFAQWLRFLRTQLLAFGYRQGNTERRISAVARTVYCEWWDYIVMDAQDRDDCPWSDQHRNLQ